MATADELKTDTILSKSDALLLLELIQSSLSCDTEQKFKKLILDMKSLVPFDYAICLLGRNFGKKCETRFEAINISYPVEWTDRYVTKNYHRIDPIMLENFAHYSLQYWRDTYRKYSPQKHFIKEAEDFNLRTGYSIGQRNRNETAGSLFSFAGNSVERTVRTELILTHSIPHLHRALYRLAGGNGETSRPILTNREKEVLLWVMEGKSTWEISVILGISQDTVKFHLKNIFNKFGATSRPQAIAFALGNKLITL